jgi:hypothetical protein
MSKPPSHNLNIHMYKLSELLDIFHLSYTISVDDLKRAKKTVLMTHPDKSGLGPEYFLFYKKAFDVIVNFYNNQQKQNQEMPTEEPKYVPMNTNEINKSASKKVSSVIQEMSPHEFNSKFNQLFDANMSSKPDEKRNEWFKKDDPTYQFEGEVNKQNMGVMFEKMKDQQNTNVLSRYRGVENINSGSGTKLYDEEDTDEYVQCDPFSKLKFDDLRKVHKDQTVFAVSERDINNIQRYSSMDQYKQARGQQTLNPLEKSEAERLLSMQEEQFKNRIMQKEYQSKLRTLEYEEKNKTVLSSFLQLRY